MPFRFLLNTVTGEWKTGASRVIIWKDSLTAAAAASVTALWFKVAQQGDASAHGNRSGRPAQTSLGTCRLLSWVLSCGSERWSCAEALPQRLGFTSPAITFREDQLLLIVCHLLQKEAMRRNRHSDLSLITHFCCVYFSIRASVRNQSNVSVKVHLCFTVLLTSPYQDLKA